MTTNDVRRLTDTYPTKPAAEEFLKRLTTGFEFSGPIVQNWLASIHLIDQQLKAFAEKAAPVLRELAQVDWAGIKRRMDELPQQSKAVMAVAAANKAGSLVGMTRCRASWSSLKDLRWQAHRPSMT